MWLMEHSLNTTSSFEPEYATKAWSHRSAEHHRTCYPWTDSCMFQQKKGHHAKWRWLCQYQLAPYGIAYSSRWDVTILIIVWSYLIFACQRRTPPTFNSLKTYYPFFRKKKTKTYRSRVGPILLKPPTTIQLGEGLFFLRCNHGFEGTDVCLHASGREVSWFQLQRIISVTHTICLIPHGYITLQV